MVERVPLVSRNEVAAVVRDKKGMYRAMIANGFIMPAEKQQIVTLDFMYRVKSGALWCPKSEELTHLG